MWSSLFWNNWSLFISYQKKWHISWSRWGRLIQSNNYQCHWKKQATSIKHKLMTIKWELLHYSVMVVLEFLAGMWGNGEFGIIQIFGPLVLQILLVELIVHHVHFFITTLFDLLKVSLGCLKWSRGRFFRANHRVPVSSFVLFLNFDFDDTFCHLIWWLRWDDYIALKKLCASISTATCWDTGYRFGFVVVLCSTTDVVTLLLSNSTISCLFIFYYFFCTNECWVKIYHLIQLNCTQFSFGFLFSTAVHLNRL